MRIPTRVKIGGLTFVVVVSEEVRINSNIGECLNSALELRLGARLPQERMAQTLTHEIVEAIGLEYDLGLNHKQITILAMVLYQVIVDNPVLFQEI